MIAEALPAYKTHKADNARVRRRWKIVAGAFAFVTIAALSIYRATFAPSDLLADLQPYIEKEEIRYVRIHTALMGSTPGSPVTFSLGPPTRSRILTLRKTDRRKLNNLLKAIVAQKPNWKNNVLLGSDGTFWFYAEEITPSGPTGHSFRVFGPSDPGGSNYGQRDEIVLNELTPLSPKQAFVVRLLHLGKDPFVEQ